MKTYLDESITRSTHRIDDRGLNHYGVKQVRRYKLTHQVDLVHASVESSANYGQILRFYIRTNDECDIELEIPINVVGGVARHIVELAKNFSLNPINLKL